MFFNARSEFNLLKMMYLLVYDSNQDILISNVHLDVVTRARVGLVIFLPICSSSRFMRSMDYTGGSLWNNLPATLRSISDYDEFKAQLFRFMFRNTG